MDPEHGPLAPANHRPLTQGQCRTSPARFRRQQEQALEQATQAQFDLITARTPTPKPPPTPIQIPKSPYPQTANAPTPSPAQTTPNAQAPTPSPAQANPNAQAPANRQPPNANHAPATLNQLLALYPPDTC